MTNQIKLGDLTITYSVHLDKFTIKSIVKTNTVVFPQLSKRLYYSVDSLINDVKAVNQTNRGFNHG